MCHGQKLRCEVGMETLRIAVETWRVCRLRMRYEE